LRLAFDVLGDSRNPPIVLLPGAGQTRRAWRRAAEVFADLGCHVVSPDLRGHGESEWASDADYSIQAFVNDVLGIVKGLKTPPILVGASIGGIACLIAAGESPEPVARGLVLVDVVPKMQDEGLSRVRAFMAAGAEGFASLDDAVATVSLYLPHRRRSGSGGGLEHNLRRGLDGRLYWHWDPAFHAGSRQRADQGMFARMAAAAGAVRVPTLLISGARSEVVSRDGVDHLMRLMPQARWLSVPDAAHMVAGDKNDAFIAAVSDFIASLA
jgi:pimeloyl-ACP methyl ester carboxylesterase